MSCSNDSKNLAQLSLIIRLTIDRNCLNLADK
jgi:hypothetical protein